MSKVLPSWTAAELNVQLESSTPLRLLDVREPHEFVSELGHVAGSELVPLGSVPDHLHHFHGEVREIIVICRSGMRAMKAAELLATQGLKARVLTGGMIAWNELRLPVSRDPH